MKNTISLKNMRSSKNNFNCNLNYLPTSNVLFSFYLFCTEHIKPSPGHLNCSMKRKNVKVLNILFLLGTFRFVFEGCN